jgi:hypothetical protein
MLHTRLLNCLDVTALDVCFGSKLGIGQPWLPLSEPELLCEARIEDSRRKKSG